MTYCPKQPFFNLLGGLVVPVLKINPALMAASFNSNFNLSQDSSPKYQIGKRKVFSVGTSTLFQEKVNHIWFINGVISLIKHHLVWPGLGIIFDFIKSYERIWRYNRCSRCWWYSGNVDGFLNISTPFSFQIFPFSTRLSASFPLLSWCFTLFAVTSRET